MAVFGIPKWMFVLSTAHHGAAARRDAGCSARYKNKNYSPFWSRVLCARFEVARTMEQERDTSHHEPRRREITFSRDKTAEAAGDLGEIVNRAELVPHYRFVRIN